MGVDRCAHRFEVVADHDQGAAGCDGGEQVVDAASVGGARDRCVERRHQVEGGAPEGLVGVGVGGQALDRQVAFGRGSRAPVECPLGDVGCGDPPALLSEPDRVAAFSGADVECTTGSQVGDLVDEGAVRVAAPGRLPVVAMVPVGLVGRWPGRGVQVVAGETEADHPADPAAGGRGEQHLLARVGDVAGGVEPGNRGLAGRGGLDHVAEPGRVRRRCEAERGEHLGPHPEPATDHDRVGVDAAAIGQLDRGHATVGAGDDPPDLPVDHVHPGGPQRIELGVVGRHRVVEHQRQPGAELAEEHSWVQSHRVRDDLHQAQVTNLVPMTERTVDDITSPVLGQALDVGQLVDQPGRREHASGDHRVTPDELDAEAVVPSTGHVDDAAGEHLCAVAADLLAGDRRQPRRRQSLVAEVAVQVGGGSVARLAGVDHDHRSALAAELQRCGETCRRAADDGDVAVSLDGAGGMVGHADDAIATNPATRCLPGRRGAGATRPRRPPPPPSRSRASCGSRGTRPR